MALFDRASLVQIPSGYKEGKLYNIKPFDQPFEFERGSAATRVNEDGLIETFYDEATNLLLQSNQFDITWTGQSNYNLTSNQVGYDGGNDAWLIEKTSTGNSYLAQSVSVSGIYTASLYAKAGSADSLFIYAVGGYIRFNLSTGEPFNGGGGYIDADMQDVGNGWYRCSVVGNTTTTYGIQVWSSDTSYTTGTIYIQDAQLESGYFATPYIETTTSTVTRPNRHDTPRIDYTNGKSLLLEPQRTNLLPYSNLSSGFTTTNVTLSNNQGTSPDGTSNATKVLMASGNGTHRVYDGINSSLNDDNVLSVFIKEQNDISHIGLAADTMGTQCWFSGSDGSIINANGLDAKTESFGNGWHRISVHYVANADDVKDNQFIYFSDIEHSSPNVPFDGTEEILLYGIQAEKGSYATSYIPTNGQTETRLEDVCYGGGDESTFNASEGTLYCELSALGDDITNRYIGLSDGTDDNRIILGFKNASNTVRVFSQTGTVTQVQIDATYNITNVNKIALTYKSNDVKLWVNGSEAGSSTNYTTVSEFTTLNFDSGSGNSKLKANVKALAYFPEELTDTELQELTTI